MLVYLNDVAEGGATRFDKMNIDVAPVKGKALLFFPGTKASMPDAEDAAHRDGGGGWARKVDLAVVGVRLRGEARARGRAAGAGG